MDQWIKADLKMISYTQGILLFLHLDILKMEEVMMIL